MQDEGQNRNMRKALGPAFLTRNILDYEPDVDTSLHDLIQRISQHPTFNLYNTLQFFQLDFLMKMAFSESPGHLIQGKDVLGLAKQGTPRLRHFYNWQAIPHIEAFIFRNPIWSRFIPSQTTKWAKSGIARLNARKAGGRLPGRDDLLQKYIDISEKHPDTIHLDTVANLVKSTISAGGDTTAAMMTSLLYFLLKNPQAYEKLQQELDQAVTDSALSRSSPRYSELSTLPYLDAVYKETLRLNPPIAAPLERVVPKGGAVLAGVHVPEGTIVGCVGRIVHLDKDWYGQDSEQFRPDRWLEDPKQTVLMDRAWMPFGNGNRICLGKHIVELELKKVMAALLLNFRVRFPSFCLLHVKSC
jgi:cytochrome P450